MQWIVIGLALALAIWFLGARALRGPDLQAFDDTRHGGAGSRRTRFSNGQNLNDEHRAVIASNRREATCIAPSEWAWRVCVAPGNARSPKPSCRTWRSR